MIAAFIFVALLALGITIFVHELGYSPPSVAGWSSSASPSVSAPSSSAGRRTAWVPPFAIPRRPRALPQLADMGRLKAPKRNGTVPKTRPTKKEEKKNSPKISYADKMIVAVMEPSSTPPSPSPCPACSGSSATMCGPPTHHHHRLAEEVGRWNWTWSNMISSRPAKEAGILPGDEILTVDGRRHGLHGHQNRIVTGKQTTEDGRRLVTLGIDRNGTPSADVHPELWTVEKMRHRHQSQGNLLHRRAFPRHARRGPASNPETNPSP